jgi:predicted ATP-dependent endonuclease of OLD family
MRLITIEIAGYRRFKDPTRLNLDGKLIALVGPNEAGKSTILEAVERVGDTDAISIQERTRATAPDDNRTAIEALWLLEDTDIDAISIPNRSDRPRWFVERKTFGGAIESELIPALRRDRRPREQVLKQLDQALSSKPLKALDADEEQELTLSRVEELRQQIAEAGEHLTTDMIAILRWLATQLEEGIDDAPKYVQNLIGQLRAAADHEEAEHPDDTARDVLNDLTPALLRFELAERELDSTYDLTEVADDPPRALANLAALAGLDLRALRDAIGLADRGIAIEMLDVANAQLQQRIAEAWDQSDVEPRLDNDDYVLRILVRTGKGGLQDIAQRSEGLRTFIALVAFTTERASTVAPILLIDEAEIHLHYDAQADLIQMLSRQQQAAQVVFTTHSAGCLPQDLGTGVRLVEPNEDQERSSVENWPWRKAQGFGPLLLGMGASTLAFVPTRAALIGEGGSEVVLLPTLIREAVGLQVLNFQVAPGAAEASRAAVGHIDFQGSKVAWLVDGDEGGADNRAHLESSKIPPERILTLGGAGSGLTTEDLVVADVFVEAVNEELRRSHGEDVARLTIESVPSPGRWRGLEKWCKPKGLAVPNKGAVAHRIADQRSEGALVASEHAELLRMLHDELKRLFDD